MNDQQEKLNWFNTLPAVRRCLDPLEYERTCPCGKSIWDQSPNLTLDMSSWIEIHYDHRLKIEYNTAAYEVVDSESVEPEVENADYDFARPIKFSKAGFDLFVEKFGLRKIAETELRDLYRNNEGKEFCFFRRYAREMPANDYEGVYVIFDHAMSRLKNSLTPTEEGKSIIKTGENE